MPISNYGGNKILDVLTGKTSYTLPTTYIGVFTTMPTSPSNAGTEMSGGSYARTAINTSFAAAASRSAASNATIQVTCAAATARGIGVYDALTTGNLLWYDEILTTITAESNIFATSGEGVEVIQLAQADVRNVIVKDSSDSTTYTEGTDYDVQYDTGRVVRLTTGTIGSGATVHVTYDYPTTRAFNDADILQINSGSLKLALKGQI